MSGGLPPPVQLRLRWTALGAPARTPVVGSAIRLRIDALTERGTPIDVTGLWVWQRRPSGALLRIEGGAIVRDAVGAYHADVTLDAAGTWSWEAVCTGPRDARSQALTLKVGPSRTVAASPPAPILVDDAGDPIVLNDATFWSARRVTALPEVPAIEDTDSIVLARGSGTRRASGAAFRAVGAAAGAAAAQPFAAQALAAANVLSFAPDRILTSDPAVDTTGVQDCAALFNAALAAAAAVGAVLRVGPGRYRFNSPIRLVNNAQIECHAEAVLTAHFTSVGMNGFVMAAAGFNDTTNPLRNVRIVGGRWRRHGEIAGVNNELWTGNQGNMLCFFARRMVLRDMWFTGYAGGRAMLIGGSGIIDNCHARNPDRADEMATPVAGGTGVFRPYAAEGLLFTRCTGIAGDDIFQYVPGGSPLDTVACIYDMCWGISTTARVIAAGLGDRLPGYVSNSVLHCVYRNIRGAGVVGAAIVNEESSGDMNVLLDDVRLGILPPPPHYAQFANSTIGWQLSSGNGPTDGRLYVRMTNCELLNVVNGGFVASGLRTASIVVQGWRQPAPSNPASTRPPFQLMDAEHFRLDDFEIAGRPGAASPPVVLGRNDLATQIDLVELIDGKITGIDAGQAAIFGPNNGFERIYAQNVRFHPSAGVTDALAIRFSEVTAYGMLRDCDFTQLAAVPFGNLPAGCVEWENCRFAAPTMLYQSAVVDGAGTIAWNGRSTLIRLTAASNATLHTIALPAGMHWTEIPILHLTVGNGVTITLGGTGNITPLGGGAIGPARVAAVLYDPVRGRWLQIAQAV